MWVIIGNYLNIIYKVPQKAHSHIAQKRSSGVKNKSKAKQNKSTNWLREEIKSAFAKNSTNNPPPQFTQQQNIKQTNHTYIIISKEGTADNSCVSAISKGRWKETMEHKSWRGGLAIEMIVMRIFFS